MARPALLIWRDHWGGVVFLKLTKTGELLFGDRHNFRAFKLVVEADRSRLAEVRSAIAQKAMLPDADTAWIFQETLRSWPGVEQDAEWQRHFAAMIEKARPHGWIDDEARTIKAHVEWTG
jgi:hypothetical protein